MIRLTPASGPLSLEIAGDLPVPPDLAAAIDELWAAESRRRPHLFDGPAISVAEIGENRLTLLRASYRHILAARLDAAIAVRLALRPLAVTGLLFCPDGLVFGRRGAEVTQASGAWELVPSGGVTSTDIAAQILEELEQEVGLAAADVTLLPAAGLVESLDSGVVDIVMPIETRLPAARIAARHQERASREYAELLICREDDRRLEEIPLLAETRAILAAAPGSIPGSWRSRWQNPA